MKHHKVVQLTLLVANSGGGKGEGRVLGGRL